MAVQSIENRQESDGWRVEDEAIASASWDCPTPVHLVRDPYYRHRVVRHFPHRSVSASHIVYVGDK